MNMHLPDPFTRRAFLTRGLVLASAASTLPGFIENSALAMAQAIDALRSRPGVPDERVLVIVQLSGGNDGLNTVVPYSDRAYHNARPGIRVGEREALALNDEVGLHPRLAGLKQLHDDGMLSIVQGVGYPNPNRSHFVSMDIWHTADPSATGPGWLGRYVERVEAATRLLRATFALLSAESARRTEAALEGARRLLADLHNSEVSSRAPTRSSKLPIASGGDSRAPQPSSPCSPAGLLPAPAAPATPTPATSRPISATPWS